MVGGHAARLGLARLAVRATLAHPLTIAILTLACLVAGCGGTQRHHGAPTALQQAQRTHEYPSPSPPPETAAAPSASAVAAIRAFATSYINWSFQTVSGLMRALARESIGQARSAMVLAAAETANDYELQRGGVSNRGTVEAVAPLFGDRDQYVVVTRELTTATNTTLYQGLRPAWHLTIATVAEIAPGQWAISGWQPES